MVVFRSLLNAHKRKDDMKIHRGWIFEVRLKCARHVCSLVIDIESCTDVISEDIIKKLRLKLSLIRSCMILHGLPI